MEFIDRDKLREIKPRIFQRAYPYPWINPQGFLTRSGFNTLVASLPPVDMFERRFDKQRDFGQKYHDRYTLEYDEKLQIAPEWHRFVKELHGNGYTRWARKLLGAWVLKLSFHWHYTPCGCSVSPHCDSRGKLGSHIFYFNTDEDWQGEWGGETVILDDRGKLTSRSAPEFEDFFEEIPAETLGNRSLLFKRTEHAWHGVREIRCPEDKLRKVFIVVFERVRPLKTIKKGLRERFAG